MNEQRSQPEEVTRTRLLLFIALLCWWGFAITARLYELQVYRYDFYHMRAKREQRVDAQVLPRRGSVFDARGRELALSVQVDSLWADTTAISDPAKTAGLLSNLLGISRTSLARRLSSEREFVWVARHLEPSLSAAVRRLNLPGLGFVPEFKRYYPHRALAGQILGFVGTDDQGLAGLEEIYNSILAGKPGREVMLRDAIRGRFAYPGYILKPATPGRDIYLTIDIAAQFLVERELLIGIGEAGESRITSVVLDPENGTVLALANLPGFDPNDFGSYPPARWKNRAVEDAFDPGPPIAMITAAMALQTGRLSIDTPIALESEEASLFRHEARELSSHPIHGTVNFGEATAYLSRAASSKAALLLGDEGIFSKFSSLGFGRPTSIDLPGENPGIFPPLRHWTPDMKLDVARGRRMSASPLQIALAFAALVNGGFLYQPVLAKDFRQRGSSFLKRPFSAETCAQILPSFDQISLSVDDASKHYKIAGKGYRGPAGRPLGSADLEWYLGFSPIHHPRLLVLVVETHNQSAIQITNDFKVAHGMGARDVVLATMRELLRYYRIPPDGDPTSVRQ